MESVCKELRVMNQRLSNIEFQIKEGKEDRKDLRKSFKSFCEKFQENKVEFTGRLNSHFEDDSFTSSSVNVQQRDKQPRDVALNNLNAGQSGGKSRFLITSLGLL